MFCFTHTHALSKISWCTQISLHINVNSISKTITTTAEASERAQNSIEFFAMTLFLYHISRMMRDRSVFVRAFLYFIHLFDCVWVDLSRSVSLCLALILALSFLSHWCVPIFRCVCVCMSDVSFTRPYFHMSVFTVLFIFTLKASLALLSLTLFFSALPWHCNINVGNVFRFTNYNG